MSVNLRKTLTAGLFSLVPIVVTAWIVIRLFLWLDGLLNEPVSRLLSPIIWPNEPVRTIPGVGIPALLLVLLLTGMAARNFVGRMVLRWSDRLLHKLPIIRHIYSTLRQIAFVFSPEKKETMQRAVLIEYPRPGMYAVGFISQEAGGAVQQTIRRHFNQECYSIFLPTTPNPTSGFLLFVPKKDVYELNLSLEEALKLIISGGAVLPEEPQSTETDRRSAGEKLE
ncbi:MAG: DUF502 domain-containing protein [candidate division KSB1 bacterium]|nr:DUF502 domain-containing protein [candidate division KSB1 bacterium]